MTQVEKNYRWNFSVNVLDVAFYTLAMSVISQATILPLLISQLTPSKLVIGLVPAIYSLGFLLPQLLTASYTEQLKRKLPFLSPASAIGERTPYLLMAIFIFFFAKNTPGVALAAILILIGISSTTAGVLTPAWYDLIAKVIPIERRGVWSGTGFGLGAFMAIAGAALAGVILERWSFPTNFAICFLIAYIFNMVSWLGLSLNREPESEVTKPAVPFSAYLRQLPAIIRRDRNYQIYLISRSIANLGSMASGFFIVFGAERFGLEGAEVGLLTGILVASQTLMNLLLGVLADRKGHKIVLVLGALGMGLSAFSALVAQGHQALYAVFFFLGMAMAAESVSSLNIILEFCAPEDRPTYIGLTNTLLAPTRAIAPLVGGWLATWLGYSPLFVIALILSVGGSWLLARWLREPRKGKGTQVGTIDSSPVSLPVEDESSNV
jgi:MFS family permease